jgi:GntR family transcriptional regulator
MHGPAVSYSVPMIDPEAEEPVYLQLASLVRAKIASGEYARRVPSARTLAQEFGVSKGSAEKALAVLARAGVVRARVGKGFFVIRDQDAAPSVIPENQTRREP